MSQNGSRQTLRNHTRRYIAFAHGSANASGIMLNPGKSRAPRRVASSRVSQSPVKTHLKNATRKIRAALSERCSREECIRELAPGCSLWRARSGINPVGPTRATARYKGTCIRALCVCTRVVQAAPDLRPFLLTTDQLMRASCSETATEESNWIIF